MQTEIFLQDTHFLIKSNYKMKKEIVSVVDVDDLMRCVTVIINDIHRSVRTIRRLSYEIGFLRTLLLLLV
jgi:hypothetical protein